MYQTSTKAQLFYKYSFKHIKSWYSILRRSQIIQGGGKKQFLQIVCESWE